MVKWHDADRIQPDVDEGYWQAILQQGEWADSSAPRITLPEHGLGVPVSAVNVERRGSEPRTEDGAPEDWELAKSALTLETVLELDVVGHNRGGLLLAWNSLRGFVPASHLLGFPTYLDEEERRQELARRIGERLNVRIIEIDCVNHRLVLSERAASSESQRRHQLLNEIQAGDVRIGQVTNVCDFGVFVDLGGIEGLMHISEISWGRVNHPSDLLTPGQEIDVYIMSVDAAQGRIALSVKRLHPDPWASVEARYQVGQMIEGRVTNVVNFGAFVCVEDGLEGLIHISQLAEGQFLHPRSVVREGQMVRARIMSIDGAQRRLALTLRHGEDNGHRLVEDVAYGAA